MATKNNGILNERTKSPAIWPQISIRKWTNGGGLLCRNLGSNTTNWLLFFQNVCKMWVKHICVYRSVWLRVLLVIERDWLFFPCYILYYCLSHSSLDRRSESWYVPKLWGFHPPIPVFSHFFLSYMQILDLLMRACYSQIPSVPLAVCRQKKGKKWHCSNETNLSKSWSTYPLKRCITDSLPLISCG